MYSVVETGLTDYDKLELISFKTHFKKKQNPKIIPNEIQVMPVRCISP